MTEFLQVPPQTHLALPSSQLPGIKTRRKRLNETTLFLTVEPSGMRSKSPGIQDHLDG
ncbi:hypothetical protein LINPERHAP2_LOCUS415 [Linum perenne]